MESEAFVRQFVDEALGNSTHLVGSRSKGVGALIDPAREVDRYLEVADRLGVRIAYALETHLHNDFVSGAREVASRTGAVVGASAEGGTEFDHRPLKGGDVLPLADLTLRVLATPGHSPEHLSFVLIREESRPAALFCGGALTVGGAGRTDLMGPERRDPLARALFATIRDRIMRLPDDVEVYPTHGAGSLCAAPAGEARASTIGRERRWNRLARAGSEEAFVRLVAEGLPPVPPYFTELQPVNRRGPALLSELPRVEPWPPGRLDGWMREGGAVLDVRPPDAFGAGHVPGAYGISLWAPLVVWAGWLIPFGTPLALIARAPEEVRAAVGALRSIGYDAVQGYLEGGMGSWAAAGLPIERVVRTTPVELRARMRGPDPPLVVDVRTREEWDHGHIPGARHVPNGDLAAEGLDLPKDRTIVVHCQTYNRSTVGLSVLRRRGYEDVRLLEGGFAAWSMWGLEVERGP